VSDGSRPRWPGLCSLVGAVAMLVLEIVAISLGGSGSGLWPLSTVLAWIVIVATAICFILGMVAIVTGRGRRLGVAGAVLGVLVNPLVQLWVLGLPAG